MKTLPISVIIPTFNRKKMVVRAIDSVLCQSTGCSEIIIIDDGSTDGTKEFIESWAEKEQKIVYLNQENLGPAAARNRAIHASRFDYIAFLDSDDHWQKKKLERQFHALSGSDYLISHTKERWCRRGVHLNQKKIHIPRHGDIFDHCLQLCAVGMSTVMVKKELFAKIGYFDEKLRCCEDYDLWLRASAYLPFLLIDQPFTIKEGGREDQVSFQYRVGMDKLRIASIDKLLQTKDLQPWQRELAVEEIIRKLSIFSSGCLKHGRSEEAAPYLAMLDKYKNIESSSCLSDSEK